MVRDESVESEKKIITIKAALKPEILIRHPKTFMRVLGGNPSTQMSGLGSSFQYEESNSMVAEAMYQYVLAYAESAYEYPGETSVNGINGGRRRIS